MKQCILLMVVAISLINHPAFAQHSEKNDSTIVAERIFKAMKSRDFSAFKMTVEQSGLVIGSDGDEIHPFWSTMKDFVESNSTCEGWDLIAELELSERFYISSYIYYTETPHYVTLEFYKHRTLWTLRSFDIYDDLNKYTREWGFMLNKREQILNNKAIE